MYTYLKLSAISLAWVRPSIQGFYQTFLFKKRRDWSSSLVANQMRQVWSDFVFEVLCHNCELEYEWAKCYLCLHVYLCVCMWPVRCDEHDPIWIWVLSWLWICIWAYAFVYVCVCVRVFDQHTHCVCVCVCVCVCWRGKTPLSNKSVVWCSISSICQPDIIHASMCFSLSLCIYIYRYIYVCIYIHTHTHTCSTTKQRQRKLMCDRKTSIHTYIHTHKH
jgi:hypothetical protein